MGFEGVFEVTKDETRASYSVRISLSGLTTNEEVETFLKAFDACYKKLNLK